MKRRRGEEAIVASDDRAGAALEAHMAAWAAEVAEAASTTARTRANVTDEEFVKALSPIVERKGCSFIQYDAAETVEASKLMIKEISEAHDVLSALYSIFPKLSFKRAQVEKVSKILRKCHGKKWALTGVQIADWDQVIPRRLMNIAYQVKTNQSKNKKQPPWVKQLPWNLAKATNTIVAAVSRGGGEHTSELEEAIEIEIAADAEKRSGEEEEAAAAERRKRWRRLTSAAEEDPDFEWEFGWHRELHTAYRRKLGTRGLKWTKANYFAFARAAVDDESKDDADFYVATFEDDRIAEISDLTYGQLRGILNGRRQKVSEGPMWTGVHAKTHHKLAIVERDDREVLFSCTEQGRQLLQAHAERFGPLPKPREGVAVEVVGNDHPTMKLGCEFLAPLMKTYGIGEWSVQDLKNAFKEKVEAQGIPKTLATARKKNAQLEAKAVKQEEEKEPKGVKKEDEPSPKVAKKEKEPKPQVEEDGEAPTSTGRGRRRTSKRPYTTQMTPPVEPAPAEPITKKPKVEAEANVGQQKTKVEPGANAVPAKARGPKRSSGTSGDVDSARLDDAKSEHPSGASSNAAGTTSGSSLGTFFSPMGTDLLGDVRTALESLRR